MVVFLNSQKEQNEAKKNMKGGAFKLNNYPKDVFDENPYSSKKRKFIATV